jgi:hypothetical protein
VALTQLRYPDAAKRFTEAAAKLPEGHDDERWICLNLEADALYRQGDEFGNNAAAAFDLENKVWAIPAHRMKTCCEHPHD